MKEKNIGSKETPHSQKNIYKMQNAALAGFPVLVTERLTLRQLLLTDDQQIFSLRSNNEINKYLDRPLCSSVDDAGNFISKIIKSGALYWAITLTGKNILIGTICLFDFSDDHCECEIGYELLPDFQKQGIMKETVQKVIDYAFHTIAVKKITASLHRDNQNSIKLLRAFSFSNSDESGYTDSEILCFHLTNLEGTYCI